MEEEEEEGGGREDGDDGTEGTMTTVASRHCGTSGSAFVSRKTFGRSWILRKGTTTTTPLLLLLLLLLRGERTEATSTVMMVRTTTSWDVARGRRQPRRFFNFFYRP